MKMIFLLSFALLFCGSAVTRGESNDPVKFYFPDMREFGAMRDQLRSIQAKLKEREGHILELKNKENNRIVFTAAMKGLEQIGPFDTNTTLVFGNVMTNVGNAYNGFTGFFTAPVAGIYYFTFSYHAGGSYPIELHLMKNAESVVTAYNDLTDNGAINGGNAAFLQLVQGDQVHVLLAARAHVWGTRQSTTFSGFLLSQA